MTEQSPIDDIDAMSISHFKGVVALVIARLIRTKQIIPSKIRSKRRFLDLWEKIGRSDDYAFEVHIDHSENRLNSIQLCLENDDPVSAVLLLHSLIESEVNTTVRVLLRLRGFSNSEITDTIKGVDLKSKLEVLLPLLDIRPSHNVRQLRSASQNIRNSIVHFKALPLIATNEGERKGDHDVLMEKAADFFRSHPMKVIRKDLSSFLDTCVSQCPEIQSAHRLLRRFMF